MIVSNPQERVKLEKSFLEFIGRIYAKKAAIPKVKPKFLSASWICSCSEKSAVKSKHTGAKILPIISILATKMSQGDEFTQRFNNGIKILDDCKIQAVKNPIK